MPKITLKKPISDGEKTWSEIDFDPSLNALKAFNQDVNVKGIDEVQALINLMAFDGDIPVEVAGQVRSSDLVRIKDVIDGPFGDASTTSAAGAPAPPS